MGDSIWKKEISFGKKAKEPKPEAEAPQQQSFLKKEISFSRKPKEPKPAAEPSQSFLKKEISFGRKPKEPKAPAAESTSIWKKELSFGKGKAKQDELARLMESAAQAVDPSYEAAPAPATPPTAVAEAVVAAMPPAEPAPEAPVFAHHEPVAPPPAPVETPEAPVFAHHEPVEAVAPSPAPAPAEPEAPVFAHHEPVEPVVLAAVPDVEPVAPAQPAASEPVVLEPVAPQPEPPAPVLPEPAVPQPEPVAVQPEPVAAEPWLAGPELPPEPVPTALPVVVHPPVPAAELPPLPEPKVPFWKKELGGKKQSAPAATGEPSVPFWKKELGGKKQSAPAATGEPSVPFWKKELGGKKKSAPAATGEPSVPFWKKELGGKKKSAATAAAPAGSKVRWWKKEIGGKKQAQPAVADAPTEVMPVAETPSAPFWKKQLNLSLPSVSRGGGHSAKKLVGLKVGASQIAAACVSNNGSVQLERVVREPLLPGVVVGGELRDPDALGDALKAFFARNKLPKKGVRLGLASNRIGVRIVDIVGVAEDKQLANAVQFRAQEALPIPLDEAVLDYRVLGESTDEEGQPVKRVLLVVAHRELVERYVEACKRAGISLMGIDLEAFALLRSLAAPIDRGSSALVAVAVGHDRSTFAVSDGRTCEFTRVLEWGGWMLNVALARVFESTPSEVEALKRHLSLDGSVQPENLTPEQLALAIDALRKQVQVFARELVSSLQFYQGQPGSLGIGEIVLTGGTAHLPGMAEELQRLIGVPVRVGDPLARVVVAKKVGAPEQVGSLAVAIGLGIED
jgi:type IV pilus assembly protein PilM